MKTKLTLSIDKSLIQYAQRQARDDGRSISGMFSDFLRAYKAQAEKHARPSVAAMTGTLKQYKIDDSKTAIRAAYAEKYR